MQDTLDVSCPFCGESSCLAVDASQGSQRFTTDCEVCCRPMEVILQCEDGEILGLDVRPG